MARVAKTLGAMREELQDGLGFLRSEAYLLRPLWGCGAAADRELASGATGGHGVASGRGNSPGRLPSLPGLVGD